MRFSGEGNFHTARTTLLVLLVQVDIAENEDVFENTVV